MLIERRGQDFEHYWRGTFGYCSGCLTDIEAGYLARVESVDAIATRKAEAAAEANRRGLPGSWV